MMQSEVNMPAPVSESPAGGLGIWYDPERIVLEGAYSDQITAYRARRRWISTLETNFLLEERHDFRVKVVNDEERNSFRVRCDFLTACGRYAFWRLTHNQAPEVQYLIETAHLPSVTIIPEPAILLDEVFPDGEPQMYSRRNHRRGTLHWFMHRVGSWFRSRWM